MKSLAPKSAAALFVLLLFPAAAYAQASITGVVKDSSGGVLPGVTVEASSPVLIEKVRSAVTDDAGLYRIVDLRPGTYTVDVHVARVHHREARRRRAHRHVRRNHQRGYEGGRPLGNDHGHRRDAGRRLSEHDARDDDQQGRHPGAAGDARVRLAAERHAGRDGRQQRPGHDADDDVLQRARRQDQRRTHVHQRHERGGGVQRRRRVVADLRYEQRRGSLDARLGRPRREPRRAVRR